MRDEKAKVEEKDGEFGGEDGGDVGDFDAVGDLIVCEWLIIIGFKGVGRVTLTHDCKSLPLMFH